MKKFILYIGIALAFYGCEKQGFDYGDLTKYDNTKALVKINYASAYPKDPAVAIKFNGSRVTPLIIGRTPYPGGGYNTNGPSNPDYLMVDPGNLKVDVILPKKIDDGTDSLILYSANYTLEGGTPYTLHIADTAQLTKSVLIPEQFQMPDSGYARYRFINLMPNVPAIDLYYGQNATSVVGERLVASNIKYMEIGEYFTINRASTRTWKIRAAGADATTINTVLASYAGTGALGNQREYTIYAMGYQGNTLPSGKPYISFLLVR
ncbi:protein of unknown function [bacterium A37T11]|nr:protein of unknown function [bacterium A37T11]